MHPLKVPRRWTSRRGDGDGDETDAVSEGVIADGRHGGRGGDGDEAGAVFEGTVADGCHRVRDGDGPETGIVVESTGGDCRYIVLYFNGHVLVVPRHRTMHVLDHLEFPLCHIVVVVLVGVNLNGQYIFHSCGSGLT